MLEKNMDDFVDQLKNPRRNWPMYFTSEDVLCARAAKVITQLRQQNRRLKEKGLKDD